MAGCLAAAGLAVACAAPAGGAGEVGPRPVVLAVRTPPGDGDHGLAAAIRAGRFYRRALPRLVGVRLEVGPAAAGSVDILLDVAPAAMAAGAARSAGLPLRVTESAVELAGSRYDAPGQAVAVRLPAGTRTTWLVVGVDAAGAVALADRLLFELADKAGAFGDAGGGAGGDRADRDRNAGPHPWTLGFDFMVREAPRLERRGQWRQAAGAVVVDPASERDDLREWQRAAAALRELPGERVTLLASPARLAGHGRAELERLAAELDGAVAAMAPRLLGGSARELRQPEPPIVVAVEDDFVEQARHTGEIGEAVPAAAPGDRAELHLVFHPDDLFAYRVALAGRLIARAGLGRAAGMAPTAPWLERGAALWLAGDWYGRPYRQWLPWLAGAEVLPTGAELLAPATPTEGSTVLWTPVAAALIDHQPGETLAAKLAAVRRLTPREVDSWLAGLATRQPFAGVAAATAARAHPAATSTAARATGGDARGDARGEAPAAPLPFLRGVSLAMENSLEGGYHAPALDRQLDRLAAMGADAVSLMPFAFEEGPSAPRLHLLGGGPESETDVGLVHAVRRARAHGLRTLYKPHVWVGGGSWPGDVAMRDEAAWREWWRDYRRYVLHHAVLARWSGADLFSIGCELSGTLGRAEEWRQLIAAVRQVFPGPLTYAGNWSGDLELAPFWEQLDLVGVDAYFPLSPDPAAGRAELARGAAAVVARLAAASHAHRRPLLLTEVGFAACRATWTAPHREGGTPSQADQAAAYAALFGALGHPPWLAGAFVWKAFSGEAAAADRPAAARRRREETAADFRFLGRQAEAAIAAYYSRR
ncbi:MAG TPA: hypothetical protein VHB47_14845 [Thermoanaerobaculia bacterium]|nr:hypothetical protein [Thermoanaerobaculia bacterium]